MIIDFQKLVEFNNKHPDLDFTFYDFVLLNLIISDETTEEMIYSYEDYLSGSSIGEILKYYEKLGLLKITGDNLKDVSIRDLGLELIGQSKSDTVIELATKIRNLFPIGVKSGGYPVRSSVVDIADKLRKFFKKHKYTQEQVLEATKRYVDRKSKEGYSYMQKAVFFIEKEGSSTLAAECDELKDEGRYVEPIDIMKRL